MNERERLKVLLEHWIEHNQEHGEEFTRWAEKASDMGETQVGENIAEAVRRLGEVNGFLSQAIEGLS